MTRLTLDSLKGMWAGLPVPWTEKDEIDEEALRENVRRICGVGVPGVYTHGTTGEFYAQTTEEWKRVVKATLEESRASGTPTQVGCTATWTGEVIRRVAYAQESGADGVQVAFPFWMQVTDDQAVRFLKEVTTAVPGVPVIIYNTGRSKKPLTVDLLKRIVEAGIPVLGCKHVRSVEELQTLQAVAPQVRFFVGEHELAGWWKYGARGCYSSLIYACPRFMLRYASLCERGDPEAEAIARGLQQLITEYVLPRYQRGMYDTAFDRLFATATGFLTGKLLLSRGPYDPPTARDVEDFRARCAHNLPQFIEEI